MTENLDLSTFKLLKKFVSKGGTLIAFSVPTLVDGAVSEDLKELFDARNENIIIAEKLTPDTIDKYFSSRK